MGNESERLVIEGNALYEIDMECLKRRQGRRRPQDIRNTEKKEQKNRPGK